jgi:hypothetical protein
LVAQRGFFEDTDVEIAELEACGREGEIVLKFESRYPTIFAALSGVVVRHNRMIKELT